MTNSKNEMILTFAKIKSVELVIAANGNFTIDMGDGKSEQFTGNGSDSMYSYLYQNDNEQTILITGDNITGLKCHDNQLMSLNVSKNNVLTELFC